ncbi:MAG: hypothetical protein K2X27_15335 [Candidatus Obscuribacterales bacterium]|nr:hypothetical protein [Candidatus Obscuribacterales bacterium]
MKTEISKLRSLSREHEIPCISKLALSKSELQYQFIKSGSGLFEHLSAAFHVVLVGGFILMLLNFFQGDSLKIFSTSIATASKKAELDFKEKTQTRKADIATLKENSTQSQTAAALNSSQNEAAISDKLEDQTAGDSTTGKPDEELPAPDSESQIQCVEEIYNTDTALSERARDADKGQPARAEAYYSIQSDIVRAHPELKEFVMSPRFGQIPARLSSRLSTYQ